MSMFISIPESESDKDGSRTIKLSISGREYTATLSHNRIELTSEDELIVAIYGDNVYSSYTSYHGDVEKIRKEYISKPEICTDKIMNVIKKNPKKAYAKAEFKDGIYLANFQKFNKDYISSYDARINSLLQYVDVAGFMYAFYCAGVILVGGEENNKVILDEVLTSSDKDYDELTHFFDVPI